MIEAPESQALSHYLLAPPQTRDTLLEGKIADTNFWFVQNPSKFNDPGQGPSEEYFAKWDPLNRPQFKNGRQGLIIDGRTGYWSATDARSTVENAVGCIAEYEEIAGLPDLL